MSKSDISQLCSGVESFSLNGNSSVLDDIVSDYADAVKQCKEWAINALLAKYSHPTTLPPPPPQWLNCSEVELSPCLRKELFLFAYVFPFLLVFSLYGNLMNILTYRRQQKLRVSATIRLLTVRALSNIGFLICMLPEQIYGQVYILHGSTAKWPALTRIYWRSKPGMIMMINFFGTASTLATVQMTIERWLYIGFPMQSKRWCTLRSVTWLSAGTALFSMCLQLVHPLTASVKVQPLTCQQPNGVVITEQRYHLATPNYEDNPGLYLYERIYFWVYSGLIIALSIIVLLVCSFLICIKLWSFQRLVGSSFSKRSSSQKKCVTLLTIVTAICHLLFETPSMMNFIYAGFRKANEAVTDEICSAALVSNFLSIVNATLPFFVYLACVNQFRKVFLRQYCGRCLGRDSASANGGGVGLLSVAAATTHHRESSTIIVVPQRNQHDDFDDDDMHEMNNANCAGYKKVSSGKRPETNRKRPRLLQRLNLRFKHKRPNLPKKSNCNEQLPLACSNDKNGENQNDNANDNGVLLISQTSVDGSSSRCNSPLTLTTRSSTMSTASPKCFPVNDPKKSKRLCSHDEDDENRQRFFAKKQSVVSDGKQTKNERCNSSSSNGCQSNGHQNVPKVVINDAEVKEQSVTEDGQSQQLHWV